MGRKVKPQFIKKTRLTALVVSEALLDPRIERGAVSLVARLAAVGAKKLQAQATT